MYITLYKLFRQLHLWIRNVIHLLQLLLQEAIFKVISPWSVNFLVNRQINCCSFIALYQCPACFSGCENNFSNILAFFSTHSICQLCIQSLLKEGYKRQENRHKCRHHHTKKIEKNPPIGNLSFHPLKKEHGKAPFFRHARILLFGP